MGLHGSGWFSLISSPNEKPQITRTLLRRVLIQAKPYRKKIVGLLGLILLSAGLTLITPLILRQLIDVAIPTRDFALLIWLSVGLLIIPSLGGLLTIIQRKLNASIGEGVIFDLRVALYRRLQQMSLRFFTHTRSGELMSRLNNDVIGAQNAISNTIVNIITQFIQTIVVLIVMINLEWRLTLISVIVLPLFILAARKLGYRLRENARQQMEYNAEMNALMSETLNISGALIVKIFNQTENEVNRFRDRSQKVRDLGIKRALTGSTFFVMIGLVSAVGTALVFGLGGYLTIRGEFTVGTIVSFGAYLASLYGSLQGLSNAPVEFSTSMVSFERVFEVIDLPIEIEENPDALPIPENPVPIIFRNVSFHYDDEGGLSSVARFGQIDPDKPVFTRTKQTSSSPDDAIQTNQARDTALEDINLTIHPGELVALVGPSGSGKTTLTYLIPRLYDPNQGQILWGDTDIRNFQLHSLMSAIGMVTQETHLFHDTIRMNLLYARPKASQEEIESACRAANIHDFILNLPEGYNTIVGERGYRLSGGEKQRISIARVILKNPRLIILDEATSHLDSESEALIQQALQNVLKGRTALVIAHRLSTILNADQILVLDRGRIVERGTHQSLVSQHGLYANLVEIQFKRPKMDSASDG